MPNEKVSRVYLAVGFAVLLLVTVPYLYAHFSAGQDFLFGGFLLNPVDGYSYLAKMQQGWSGSWQFTLPYTNDPGSGSYLFMFYLLLGHVSRVLGLSRIVIFHAFRILGSILMLLALARYIHISFPEYRQRVMGYILVVTGSGLGWFAVFLGGFTMDFWVAETYPFLSSYANAHFPMGLALFTYLLRPHRQLANAWIGLLALFLVLMVPFASILLIMLQVVSLLWREIETKQMDLSRILSDRRWRSFFWILIVSTPVILYDLWISRTHPVLKIWNQQNITSSPPWWNVIISLSPALILAVGGIIPTLKNRDNRLWVAWMVLGAILAIMPWNLQRRFLVGYYIPLACLAVMGIDFIAAKVKLDYKTLAAVLLILSVPTNLIVLISGIQAASIKDPNIYLYDEEWLAMRWIRDHTRSDSLFLAAPDTGLLIPAFTGRDVIYGHPFETTFADKKKRVLERFYSGKMDESSQEAYLDEHGVDYLVYGPRERDLGGFQTLQNTVIQYQLSKLHIYQIKHTR